MLSFVLLLALASALTSVFASVSLQIPLDNQLPPVARVNQFYNWTFASNTFKSSSNSILTYTVSPLPNWLSFDANTQTFSGTPSLQDQGLPDFTITAHDGDGSAPSWCNIPVTNDLAPQLHTSIEEQFCQGNPSLSSVFLLANNSALATGYPTLRIPHGWSFSIGFSSATFISNNTVFYAVLQDDKTPVPHWMKFNPGPNTLNGVVPEDNIPASTYNLELHASDQEGYTSNTLRFSIVVADHELSMSGSSLPTINVTAESTFNFTLGSTADLTGLLVDGEQITPANVSSIFVDTSNYSDWLSYNNHSRMLTGNTENLNFNSTSGPRLPVTLTTVFNQSIRTTVQLAIEKPFFTTEDLPPYSVPDSGIVSFGLRPFMSNATGEQPSDVDVSLAVNPSYAGDCLHLDSSTLSLEGEITNDCATSEITVTFSAYSHVTHSTSHATLPMTYKMQTARGRSAPHPASLSLAAHKKLILGLSITFGIVGGISALGVVLASFRHCMRVQDTALAGEEGQKGMSESDKKWYSMMDAKTGYGWNDRNASNASLPLEKQALGTKRSRSPRDYGNIGLGLQRMPDTEKFTNVGHSVQSKTPSPAVMKKVEFMTRIRETVRNVSEKYISLGRKRPNPIRAVIGKPILMNAHEGPVLPTSSKDTSPSTLSGVTVGVTTPPSVHFGGRLTRQSSAASGNSSASIQLHANEAVVQTATRHSSISDSLRSGPARPRLVPFTSATRVPVPQLVTSSPDRSDGSGSILSARVTSQKARIWKHGEERGVVSGSSGDDLSMGLHYVRALGGDSASRNSDSIPDAHPSTYTMSTHFRSSYSLDSPDSGLEDGTLRFIAGIDCKFEYHIPVENKGKKLEARLASGDAVPDFMFFDLRTRNGKIELYGLPSIQDVGEWDVRVISPDDCSCVCRIILQVTPQSRAT